jgi:hypothetical protein
VGIFGLEEVYCPSDGSPGLAPVHRDSSCLEGVLCFGSELPADHVVDAVLVEDLCDLDSRATLDVPGRVFQRAPGHGFRIDEEE